MPLTTPRPRRRPRALVTLLVALTAGLLALSLAPAGAVPEDPPGPGTPAASPVPWAAQTGEALYLVTLAGPGTAGSTSLLPRPLVAAAMAAEQDRVLAVVGAPSPVYRWTTALNGFAVRLTPAEAESLTALADVALVERNAVRRLAAVGGGSAGVGVQGPRRGGADTVIGVVDTGIAPESPLFARVRHGLGQTAGLACEAGPGWDLTDCNGKVVGARSYVAGFGPDRLRATATLSPRDTDGHGTQMASIAAGNAGVPVTVGGERLGRYGGMAPDAQLAVYKACWSAPDPRDDGCATADLVAAIDQATADGVDVLNLSVGGPGRIDTVERALLGATEGGAVVVAAAGNGGETEAAAHPAPWVTTVGGTTGDSLRGRLAVRRGPSLAGAMLSRRGLGLARLVPAERVPAPGSTPAQARVCTPGSLDAARVRDAIVVCRRGGVGRVDKSEAVALADGAGMVLVNVRPGSTDADVHRVPTVHLDRQRGRALLAFLLDHGGARARLEPVGVVERRPRVTAWSRSGRISTRVVKPDLLAPATGVLGAVPDGPSGGPSDGWDFVTGTSAATAYTSGVAATLLARSGWTPDAVRSALVTTAAPVGGAGALRAGAGRLRPSAVDRPGLVYRLDPLDYRRWLDGDRPELNTASILLAYGADVARRTITNTGRRSLYFSSSARGLRGDVSITPAAVRLGPGESATYTVTVGRRARGPVDDGVLVWTGALGTVTRVPVVIAR